MALSGALGVWEEGESAPPAKETGFLPLAPAASRLPARCPFLPTFFPHMLQLWVLSWRWGWEMDICRGRQRPPCMGVGISPRCLGDCCCRVLSDCRIRSQAGLSPG